MRIDAHQHFWRYSPAEYAWIDGTMTALRRDFLPSDLEPQRQLQRIDGTIAVQARCSLQETRWLLDLSSRHAWIRGVVGWVDLASPLVGHQLDTFAKDPRLVGVRHPLQDEAPDFACAPAFVRGLALLADRGLAYDVLVRAHQLPQARELCQRFPAQRFVLDHVAKPDARARALQPWATQLRALAALPNVSCKLSGLATEADWQSWTPASLQPYFAAALEAFGPDRLMFGSDWPVCTCATSYERWFATVGAWLAPLQPGERAAVLGGTAERVYRLQGKALS